MDGSDRSSCATARRSFVQLWFAVMGLMLIGFIGLAIDTGYLVYTGNQLQSAADAAALAGAIQMGQGDSTVRSAAVTTAAGNLAAGSAVVLDSNSSNAATGDVVLGYFDVATKNFDPTLSPNAVKVTACRTSARNGAIGTFFGAAFGVGTVDMTRTAIALSDYAESPALVVLDPTSPASLDVGGRVTLDVEGGLAVVDSDSTAGAAKIGGSAGMTCDVLRVVGTATIANGTSFKGTLQEHGASAPDPLASLPEPDASGMTDLGTLSIGSGQIRTVTPGLYSGGWNIQGVANLQPGIYIIGPSTSTSNAAFTVGSGAKVNGDGVMLYIRRGTIKITSSGTNFNVYPPDPSRDFFPGATTYAGMSIFQSRSSTDTVKYSVNGDVVMHGTFYYPSSSLNVSSGLNNDIARLVTNQIKFTGNGTITVHWQPGPNQGGRSYLVR
jgi:Flp pilus assembly protein TadG